MDRLVGFDVQKVVGRHYENLPYHNFQHALNVVAECQKLVEKCKTYDVQVDEQVVILAALFHDAGYHQDHEEQGFESKEEYSADIAEQELNRLGLETGVINLVKECIIATHRNKPFVLVEQKVLRAADLAGLAGSYEDFLYNNEILKQELEEVHQQEIGDEEWKDVVASLIKFYLSQDIKLTPEHDDEEGFSIFHRQAQENLDRFLKR
ncbi:HD domain-containing protein [Candidatus Parcubacteria bacterium]|jgi:predicted metal-dependent HD superfamily phosphohydrolase|nr:HD domain-containing protein [Candidatus Parcubacteria bacterium]